MTDLAHGSFPEQYAKTQRFTLGRPRSFSVAPDGQHVLFLRSSSSSDAQHSLWSLDLVTGQEQLVVHAASLATEDGETDAERSRRERVRESATGIVSYTVDRDHKRVGFVVGGTAHVVDLGTLQQTTLGLPSGISDFRLSPSGDLAAYVAADALWVAPLEGEPTCLAIDDDERVTWGLAEFVAAEEMGRTRGYWWSPDGTAILAARADTSPVPLWHIADPARPTLPARPTTYPAAGSSNAIVSLAVIDVESGNKTPVVWDSASYPYLAAASWDEGEPLTFAVQSRDQRRVAVLAIDPGSGDSRAVYEMTDEPWVDLVPGSPAWVGDQLVTVEASSGAHRLVIGGRAVTPDGMQVRAIVDSLDGRVTLLASTDPLDVSVYAYSLEAREVSRITDGSGIHHAVVAGGTTVTVATDADTDPEVTVTNSAGKSFSVRSLQQETPSEPLIHFTRVPDTEIRIAVVLPPGDGPCPVVMAPYGGPHAQMVMRSRPAYSVARWFAANGFGVVIADGRGTPGCGPGNERAVHGDLATPVLEDQLSALEWACDQHPRLDKSRVGIRGWSFGGFLAALAVLRRPGSFTAAVAGAPVSDWRLYDTHYTERYLGHPDGNAELYRRSSLVDDDGLVDPAPWGVPSPELLIIHGLGDDNVYAAHALRLSQALLADARPHAFLPLPGLTHMASGATLAASLLQLELKWFQRALAG